MGMPGGYIGGTFSPIISLPLVFQLSAGRRHDMKPLRRDSKANVRFHCESTRTVPFFAWKVGVTEFIFSNNPGNRFLGGLLGGEQSLVTGICSKYCRLE